jgi:hypothetical protein
MKKSSLLLLLGLWCATTLTRAAMVYETPWELQSDGDFDGDGRRDLILVDVASGNFRIGYQSAPQVFTWAAARSGGIIPTTGLGIGRLNSLTYDSFALAGPEANRVNIVNANVPGATASPESVFIPSVGPNAVAAIDIGGGGNTTHHDLYVPSLYNGTPAHRQTLVRNNATTNRTTLLDGGVSYRRERLNPILLHTNRFPRLALFDRGVSPVADEFRVLDLSSGPPVVVDALGTLATPHPFEYVSAQFVRTNPYTQVILYPPMGWYFFQYQVIEPSPGVYSIAYTNQYVLTNFIRRLYALPGSNDTKLLVIYSNETAAAVFNFDGLSAPVPVQQFNADPGEHFTGAGVLPDAGFMAYSAPLGENTSQKFKQYLWTGSGYTNVASGDLPRVNRYTAAANVLQFRFEPFVTNTPNLLRLNVAGDWSSRPALSGSPSNIAVHVETFLNATQGLANPVATPLGPAHPLAAFGLANQYSNMISLFSFSAPAGDRVSEVNISPLPGLYPAAVKLSFTAATPSDTIRYRIGSGTWNTYAGTPVTLFTNALVQFYGQPAANPAKSAIQTAAYAFSLPTGEMDSDNDGVPDFVEAGLGLDPTAGADTDGDGYSDLEELIRGTNAMNGAAVPTNFPHLDAQAAYDLVVTPLPWDGFSNSATLIATGALLRAYDLQGSLLGLALTTNNVRPFARLTNIAIVPEHRLITRATELHYPILTTNADPVVGREMLGLAALPALALPVPAYAYGGSNLATEAARWVNTASNLYKNLPRGFATNTLTVENTLEALLVEQKIAQLLGARGSNWWTNLTLFPQRVADVIRTNAAQDTLLSLEDLTTNQPAYKLTTIFATVSNLVQHSADPDIASVRAVARDLYGISSRLNNTNPATFISPVDALRQFLWQGTVDSNYLFWATTTGQFTAASNGAAAILAAIPPRPLTNVILVVRPDSAGACRILDLHGGGATFALYDAEGVAFSFPDNFNLLPGSHVEIYGYADATNTDCAYPGLQVLSALLCSVPVASDTDGDGNLLIDTWEKKFFAGLGLTGPFADTDGDGYANVQEMLEGSDPNDVYGIPAVPAAPFAAPVLSYSENGGMGELTFQWPAGYVTQFDFEVRHTAAIGIPFAALPASAPVPLGGNSFKITFPLPGTPQHYYYLTVSLH